MGAGWAATTGRCTTCGRNKRTHHAQCSRCRVLPAAERGYDHTHRKARAAALRQLRDGTPCPRCGHGMYRGEPLDLDHTDDRTGYQGLAHRYCNRAAGGRKSNATRRQRTLPTW